MKSFITFAPECHFHHYHHHFRSSLLSEHRWDDQKVFLDPKCLSGNDFYWIQIFSL